MAKKNPIPIIWEVKGRSDVPSLRMHVNPSNLDINYSPLVNETRTLGGFAHEYWGEELTYLSANGRTAMFSMKNEGITNKNMIYTKSYAYFVSLLNIYKNNGKGYLESPGEDQNPAKITSLGIISMYYDKRMYDGFFENFDYREEADKPFYFEYSFSFKVTRILGQIEL